MQGNGLETDEVVTRWDDGRDGSRPGRVLSDHQSCSPRAVVNGTAEETGLIDLELECRQY